MFYAQIPADQRPDVAAKPAIDAVEIAGRIKASEYDGLPVVIDPTKMNANVERAVDAVENARLGHGHPDIQVNRQRITIHHDIHGIRINHNEHIDPDTFESDYLLLDDDGQELTVDGHIELIARLVTDSTSSPQIRSVISDARAQLQTIIGEAMFTTFWVIDRA